MAAITPQAVALGVGASGALVDVSTFLTGLDGVGRKYGQTDQFRDAVPGTFQFTLDNYDGRFTPENTAGAAAVGYSTTVTEGMAVSVQIGSRITSGKVRGISFPVAGNWGRVTIACGDMLVDASATDLSDLLWAQNVSDAWLYWPMDDAVTASSAQEISGNPALALSGSTVSTPPVVTFGSPGPFDRTCVRFTSVASLAATPQIYGVLGMVAPTITYPSASIGSWNFMMNAVLTPATSTIQLGCTTGYVEIAVNGPDLTCRVTNSGGTSFSTTITPGWHAMSVVLSYAATTVSIDLYIDGVFAGTATKSGISLTNTSKQPTRARFQIANDLVSTDGVMDIADLSHTPARVYGAYVGPTSETNRLTAIARAVPSLTLTAPVGLSSQVVGLADTSGQSALDAFNDVVRTEQGYIYTSTSGTLTAPTQTVIVRPRSRPVTVTASFDSVTELVNAPDFIRDLANLVSSVSVAGSYDSVTVADSALVARVGSKNTSETTVYAGNSDMTLWGQDRLVRGANVALRVARVAVDAVTTPTDRSADLLALVPGDRIRITNLPSAVLGFSTWDGWVVGGNERHNPSQNRFEFSLAPVLDAVPVFNNALFAAGTSLSLSANINAAVTTMSVATTDATFTTSSTDLPLTLLVDSEQMTVSAVTSATPQVFTVTRGVNGTTAASHLLGAQVELYDPAPTTDPTVETNFSADPGYGVSAAGVVVANAGGGSFLAPALVASGASPTGFVARITVNAPTVSACIIYIQAVIPQLVTGDAFFAQVAVRPSIAITARNRVYSNANADGTGAQTAFDGADLAISSGAFTTVPLASGTVDATRLSVRQAVRIATPMAGGTTIDFNLAIISDTPLGTWFYGSSSPTPSALCTWDGLANQSLSYRITTGRVTPAVFAF